ncbi:SIR2 family NAD-dependent protein deacylase [Caldinitratiruptor microaerophilus]|uniref:protein acetyllysine N-acetyltransferase n=1 Tax=Caldinitratiruptor microaerophilus TaxID=671077 RepID=A0AA35G994_9FIRM|nr:NAD-dependent protein deacylase [Caldinitratiruptor microaerophilus]BDG61218.1 NAD-dependent deacetylase [Caldinitratiruptor microaerophilus]
MQDPSTEAARSLAEALRRRPRTLVLTGAGASTEAGLPDWRGPSGIWRSRDPRQVASLTALEYNPVEFYQFYRHRLATLRGARPGPAHRALAALERAGYIHWLVTQNVDGLHQAAGHKTVIEVHGSLRSARCHRCGAPYPIEAVDVDVEDAADIPRCPCGGVIRPNIVLFEEVLPHDAVHAAFAAAEEADLCLVVGSSLQVGPVNLLPRLVADHGGEVAIINLMPTPFDHLARWLVPAKAGEVLAEVARELGVEVPRE